MKQGRNTQAKTAIVQMIRDSKEAMSHHDIQSLLGELCNRVTTYRVLNRLIEEGVIHKMVDMDGVVKYASCKDSCNTSHSHSHTHLHFSCTSCHTVTCLDDVQPQFKLPSNYRPKEMNFTISGLCPNCN